MDRQEPPKTPPVSPKPPTWTAPPPLQIPPQMSQNGRPPVPPPKKDKEFNFGKNLLGILASLLVFIGILLTAWASGSRWIQLCGILAAGLFLMLLGMLASRRKSAYRTFFLSVSGCGAGILYLGIMLGYWYYELLSVLGMYALFLLWAGLMYLLSRGKLPVFQNIGHIGMVVAVFSQLDNYTKFRLSSFSDRFSEQANFQLLIMTCYVCISALFYLLTNRQERPEKHLFTLYANGICVGLLGIRILIQADQFYTLFRNGVMHVQTKALSMAVCSLLLAGFLLFQYFWDMHRWLERQKASDSVWSFRCVPTQLLLWLCMLGFWQSMLSFPDWLEQSALLLGAVFCIGFWYFAQKDRVHTAAYRLTFGIAALTAAACILFCGGVLRIVGWCLYLLLLTGFGRRAKFPFAMQFSYGLFLLASWIPLLSVLNGSFWQNFVMLYSFFSLCNCVTIVLCRRLENGRALSGITQIVNLLAIFSILFMFVPLILEKLFLPWKLLLTLALVVVFSVNSDRYFREPPLEIKRHGRTVLRKISASDMCPDDSVFCHGGGPLRLYLCSSIGLCHSGQPFRQCWHTLQRHRTAVFRNAGNFFFQYHLGKTSRFAAHVQYGILWRTVLSSPIPVENRKCFFRDFPMASADSGSAHIVAGIADIAAAISASRGNRACFSDHWAASLWAWLVGHAPEVLPPILHRAGRFRHGSSFAVDSPVQAIVSENQYADRVHSASDLGRSVQLVYKTATRRVPAVDRGRAVPFSYAGNCFVGGGRRLPDRIYFAGIRFVGMVGAKNADPLCGDSNNCSYPDAAAAA